MKKYHLMPEGAETQHLSETSFGRSAPPESVLHTLSLGTKYEPRGSSDRRVKVRYSIKVKKDRPSRQPDGCHPFLRKRGTA